MAWVGVHEGDFGWVGKLTIVQGGVVQDISSYTTLQFVFKKPSGTVVTKTVEFDSDGTDGVLAYTVEEDVIDEAGDDEWAVQARIAKTGVELTSAVHEFMVTERLG